ncbi:type IV pilin-like G/H family protein [Trichocoleus sp. FACHB-262]|uniref:type IV pilin-like G/H family protein n=1 Tax=Trichocoleus sp. FACHB-262 TaxID=2692869 RepID=UPI0016866B0D|nr:type IV pilin-like G/H family protein [Trichocoleus sp. FACHB-262]MBD2123258.1 type IV pilin-like G/H family protein [Trichocoleus sp. FACHB-262]
MRVKLELLLAAKIANLMLKFITYLAIISLLISGFARPTAASSISVKAQSAKAQTLSRPSIGQWRVRLVTGDILTVLITSDGTLYLLDPSNNEATELVTQINKISDVGSIPTGTQISESFENQIKIMTQFEARLYVRALNRAQQAFHLEENHFASDVPSLGMYQDGDNENYKYSVTLIGERGVAQSIGLAKVEGLKSYAGIVATRGRGISGAITTMSILCQSNQPTTTLPPKPSQSEIDNLRCPAGYSILD